MSIAGAALRVPAAAPWISRSMKFPTHDWQFYVATAIAIAAALWLGRRYLPGRHRRRRHARPTTLTIEGRVVEK